VVNLNGQPTARPGVWRFRLEFTPLLESAQNVLGSNAVAIEFPNGGNASLSGALWDASIKLCNQVDEFGLKLATRVKQVG